MFNESFVQFVSIEIAENLRKFALVAKILSVELLVRKYILDKV